uniref:Uncharacterized protein n=1 Tax=Oryzias latipes TaxID=8090 RepID=A0A3P9H080_ORYLA
VYFLQHILLLWYQTDITSKCARLLPQWLTGLIAVSGFLLLTFIAFVVKKVWCEKSSRSFRLKVKHASWNTPQRCCWRHLHNTHSSTNHNSLTVYALKVNQLTESSRELHKCLKGCSSRRNVYTGAKAIQVLKPCCLCLVYVAVLHRDGFRKLI